MIKTRLYDSPCGTLKLGAYNGRLCLCDWTSSHRHELNLKRIRQTLHAKSEEADDSITDMAARQLDEYFAGTRRRFDIPLLLTGTAFQNTIWSALQHLGYATTTTYAQLSAATCTPRAARAVGRAVATNPISLFLPCHRVVGRDTSLTGYAGGLSAKRYLIELEQRVAGQENAL